MNSLLDYLPTLPVGEWMTHLIEWITITFSFIFEAIKETGTTQMTFFTRILGSIPPLIFIVLVMLLAYFISNKKWGLPIFVAIGLVYIYNQGLWENMLYTLTLILMASLVSMIIGIPLGILMAKNKVAHSIIQPLLDFMQTMPAFVYLIPSVAFFGIGIVPGVFASVIFALPPIVRFTNLGIQQVPKELVEAAESFGSTPKQKLFKLELPMALPTIMAGMNQTVLLSLSMVVTASMIGAPGLGTNVLSALQRGQVGNGFVSGFALVVLAIIIDRILQKANQSTQ